MSGRHRGVARVVFLVVLSVATARAAPSPRELAEWESACGPGDGVACANLGKVYLSNDGVARDVMRAVGYFRKACEAGEAAGCSNLGALYGEGSGVAKDPARAAELYRRACETDYALACANLGGAYLSGVGVSKDAARGVALNRRACDLGSMAGCHNLGVSYEGGVGVERSDEQAVRFYERSCGGGDGRSCFNLEVLAEAGRAGGPPSVARDEELFGKACKLKVAPGCRALGEHLLARKDVTRGLRSFERGCDLRDAESCTDASTLYAEGGLGPTDPTRAQGFARRARQLSRER